MSGRAQARLVAAALVAATAVAGGPAALAQMEHGHDSSAGTHVDIEYADYAPSHVDVLTGDTVMWTNVSARVHTVTADGGSFDSGRVALGSGFEHGFGASGAYPYHCRLHPTIRGEVDAHDLLLDPQPEPAAPGRSFPVSGRAALPSGTAVSVEADSGSGFEKVADTTVGSDGRFSADVAPATTTSYRAVHGTLTSPAVELVVLDHRVRAAAARRGRAIVFSASVTPASPGQTVVLQLRLRERFGWWPARRARLDSRSRARFTIHTWRRVRARLVLTRSDGATTLAQSPELHVRAGR